MKMPTLFVSHGAPVVVLTQTPASNFLRTLASQIPPPRAILAISAHWEEATPTIGLGGDTIHDFHGFPKPLYEIHYRAPVAHDLAARTTALLKDFNVKSDPARGRDHGVWTPLALAWPEAQVPVLPLSLVGGASPQTHFDIGTALRPLRDEGVLIMGSGSATHNLRARPTPEPPSWASQFVNWLDETLEHNDERQLLDWKDAAPHAEINHPSTEHFDPIFLAKGAAAGEASRRLHASFEYGFLSMNCYAFGG